MILQVHMAMMEERWHPSMAATLLFEKKDIDLKEVR